MSVVRNLITAIQNKSFVRKNSDLITQLTASASEYGSSGFTFDNFLAGNKHKLGNVELPTIIHETLKASHMNGLREYAYNDGFGRNTYPLQPKHYPNSEEYSTYSEAFEEGRKDAVNRLAKSF